MHGSTVDLAGLGLHPPGKYTGERGIGCNRTLAMTGGSDLSHRRLSQTGLSNRKRQT